MIRKMQEKIPLVEEIKAGMSRKNWKAADLARESGVGPAAISRILKGSINVKVESLSKILEVLSIKPINSELTITAQGEESTWELKMLIENLNHRINDLSSSLEGMRRLISGFSDNQKSMWQVIREKDTLLTSINERLLDAAKTGDVKSLGERREVG